MKKFLLVLFALQSLPCFAATMCAQNDIVPVILDSTIKKVGSGNFGGASWYRQYPYGRISGIWACVDVAGSTGGTPVANLTDSNGNRVIGSQKNGRYCWCKMTTPLTSQWVYFYDLKTAEQCAARCLSGPWPYGCAGSAADFNNTTMEKGWFRSINPQ